MAKSWKDNKYNNNYQGRLKDRGIKKNRQKRANNQIILDDVFDDFDDVLDGVQCDEKERELFKSLDISFDDQYYGEQ